MGSIARFTRGGIAAALTASLLVAIGAPADAAPVEPLFTDRIEGYAEYDGADTCSPSAKPGAVALLDLLTDAYPGTYGYISRECSGPPNSEHNEGRAVDWMISAEDDRDKADDLFEWLFADDAYGHANAMIRRLGIMYMIWDREIWRAYDHEAGWQPYSGASPHTDHIHFSMSWDGALRETSWTTGVDEGLLLDQARFSATWRGEKRLDVFRRAPSGILQQRIWDGAWGSWGDLDGDLTSGPAAVWSSRNKLWIFARGADGTLMQRRWRDGRSWSAWKDKRIRVSAAPGVAVNDGRLDLFVVTASGSLSHRSWVPKSDRGPEQERRRGGWSRWDDLGGSLTAPPAAAWTTPGSLDVFARGTSGMLHQQTYVNGDWSGWSGLGGVLTSGPSAVSTERGAVEVYVRTARGSISERSHVDDWSGWVDLGGMHVSAAAATGLQRERRDLFTRERGGGMAQNYRLSGGNWSGWALR